MVNFIQRKNLLFVILIGVNVFSNRLNVYTNLHIVRLKHLRGFVILWVDGLKEEKSSAFNGLSGMVILFLIALHIRYPE
jgi:hypothetical protein